MTWIQASTLKELLDLKAQHPEAKLVVGNTELGEARLPASTPCGPVSSVCPTKTAFSSSALFPISYVAAIRPSLRLL